MTDELHMRRCFELARRGLGYTRTNPIVGAVLVHQNRVIGEGWHKVWGGPHAEVECLNSVEVGDRHLVPHSTMYVSLEPCAHWGKQPPCAERIVREGIKKVVVSVDDPNPQVSGKGFELLEKEGIQVVRGFLVEEGRWTIRRFLSLHKQHRPYVILKWAQSADGYMAPVHEYRVMLSNAVSQRLVHKWRAEEDAILVGYRTALFDNPQLTARRWEGPQPLRIILDREASLPTSHLLFSDSVATWIASEKINPELPAHVRSLELPFDDTLFPSLMRELVAADVSSIIIEGGKATLGTLLSSGLWDEARVFSTPVVLGGGLPAPQLKHAVPGFQTAVGDDTLFVFTQAASRFSYPAGAEL